MSVLVLGHRGRIGRALMRALEGREALRGADRAEVDIGDRDALRALLDACAPGTIVNAAAWTAVDRAEAEPATVHRVNGEAVGWMAQWAAERGARLVHYSTDYVFDGSGTAPWREDSPTGPLSVYGAAKLDGERRLAASGCRHLLLRTSWVYADHGDDFVHTMLRLGRERATLSVVDDQHGVPTCAAWIAAMTARALDAHRDGRLADGLYHLVPAGATTRHGVAVRVLARARANGATLAIDPDRIEPIPTARFPLPARRPLNSRLDATRLARALGIDLPDWTVDLDRTVDRLTREGAPR